MLRSELFEILANRENSGVEFKRDDIRPEQLGKEIVALANLNGGRILLGVEDDGTISGIQRPELQEWVLNVFRDKVHPQILPFYEEVQVEDKRVAVISLLQGISKPYVLRNNGREDIYVRMGDRSELATREQQARLFALGGMLHTEVMPVSGSTLESLDLVRLTDYLQNILRDPEVPGTSEAWILRLKGMGFLADGPDSQPVCTLAGILLFGHAPRRTLRQSGIRLLAFDGLDKEYRALLDTVLDGPMVGRWQMDAGERTLTDGGLIERFVELAEPFFKLESAEVDDGFRREMQWLYPRDAVREALVNALIHRDWTRSIDIEIGFYSDRLEINSPGAMQNSMTIEKMKMGQRSPRNPILVEVMRDYGYMDARGMGVRTKIIPLMRSQNGTEPVFELTDDYLKTTLFKKSV
jgi:ATP-dependent DNA helicase RecG